MGLVTPLYSILVLNNFEIQMFQCRVHGFSIFKGCLNWRNFSHNLGACDFVFWMVHLDKRGGECIIS